MGSSVVLATAGYDHTIRCEGVQGTRDQEFHACWHQ